MPVVKKYKSEVVSAVNLAEGIYTLELKPPGRRFKFTPGQFLHLALDEYDPSEAWPQSRCFSVQTSPAEQNLKITFSVKGNFTKQMAEQLKEGTEVWLKMPYGDLFTQEHKKENTVFIAGGTGLTPYLSLFTDASFSDYSSPKLYAGFRNENYDLYKTELEKATQINPSLSIFRFFENKDGIIDIKKILKENGSEPTYFISGPPAMIKNFSEYLKQNGVAEGHIKTDDWE